MSLSVRESSLVRKLMATPLRPNRPDRPILQSQRTHHLIIIVQYHQQKQGHAINAEQFEPCDVKQISKTIE